jgi:hypothetical protein
MLFRIGARHGDRVSLFLRVGISRAVLREGNSENSLRYEEDTLVCPGLNINLAVNRDYTDP